MDDHDALRTYLNNHFSGGVAAIEMAEHCARVNKGTPLALFLIDFVQKIRVDHQTLHELMEKMDTPQNRTKRALARIGEKASHLKLHGNELGNLLTIETLSLGVEGKASLWKSLRHVQGDIPSLSQVEFDGLIKRAQAQRRALEPWRLAAAAAALSDHPSA